MKTLHTIVGLLLTISSFSQETREVQTIFDSGTGIGGFLGMSSKFTTINSDDALFLGGEIGMVVSHSLNFGFAGYGMVTPVISDRLDDNGNQLYLQMGYGGLHFEPILRSDNLVHLTFPILLGAGATGYTSHHFWDGYPNDDPNFEFDEDLKYSRLFLVAEPGVNMELNVFRWMRMGAGASYRLVHRLENDPGTEELSGISANINLRFGWF